MPLIQEETVTLKRGQVLQVTYLKPYNPIVVPDTDNAFSKVGFEGMPFFTECAWNMGLRITL